MKDWVGTTIDRYRIINELGQGGMAVVYRAIDTILDRNVAIKMIMPEGSNREKLSKRFSREAKTLAKLTHANIVKVLDYGDYEETPYLVMEYISGGTLKSLLGKPIKYPEAAAMLAPIARALNYAHQQKVVHRDVKPANILINDSGQPMLSDFGILKLVDVEESQGLTGTGRIVGTPAYMSPEQIRGKEVDGRTDIYSLGVVFFEMVTGRKPFVANTPIELSMQHLHDPIPKVRQIVRDLPAEVEQVILRSMAKNPEERYPSMESFAQALEKLAGIASRTTSSGWSITSGERDGSSGRRQVGIMNLALLISPFLVILGLGAIYLNQRGLISAFDGNSAIINTKTAAGLAPDRALATPSPSKIANAVTFTPAAGYTLEVATPIGATPEIPIQSSNVSQMVEVNRISKISVVNLIWMQNAQLLISAGTNNISFIDPKTMSIKAKINLPGDLPISMAITPANDKLFVLLINSIKVFDTQTRQLLTSYSISGGANSITASPDGKLIALGNLDKVQLINAEDGRFVRNLKSNYGGWSVAFSPDSSIIAGGTSQGSLMWETDTGSWLPLTGGQNNLIKSVAFSNDGKMLAGGSNGIIFFWNVADGSALFQAKGDFGTINSLDFSPDNSILVSGSDDGLVRLWDTTAGTLLKELTGHTSPVLSVAFSPGGQSIASGANEGTIRIWGIP